MSILYLSIDLSLGDRLLAATNPDNSLYSKKLGL